jgi:hypothetical protein
LGRIWPTYTILHHTEMEYSIFFTAKVFRPVVASLKLMNYRVSSEGVSYGDRTAELYLYPVRLSEYSKDAAEEFRMEVLPMIKNWLNAEMSKPDTQYLTGQTLVIEFTGETHKRHVLRRR